MLHDDKPALDEDLLIHYGVVGMHWGVRKNNYEGASNRTNREARKDAEEFARAKMFYGEGAGTRRKLIKAKVEAKAKKDPVYKAAFDHHVSRQDLGQHGEKARAERRRKDVKAGVGKNARAVNRMVNGPFAAPVAIAATTAGYQFAKSRGLDAKFKDAVSGFMRNQRMRREVNDLLSGLVGR